MFLQFYKLTHMSICDLLINSTFYIFHTRESQNLFPEISKKWPKVRSVKFELFHTLVKLRVCFGMQFPVLDVPYVWPYLIAKSIRDVSYVDTHRDCGEKILACTVSAHYRIRG